MDRQLRHLIEQVNSARDEVGRSAINKGDTELGWRGFPKLSFDFLSRKAKAQLRHPETKEWVEERGDLDIPGFNEPEARAHIDDEVDALKLPDDDVDIFESKKYVEPAKVADRVTKKGKEVEDLIFSHQFDLRDPYFMDEQALYERADQLLLGKYAEGSSKLRSELFDLIDKLYNPKVPKHEKPRLHDFYRLGRGTDFFQKEWFGKDLIAGDESPTIGLVKYANEYERQKVYEGEPYDLPSIERQPPPSPAEVEAALAVVDDQVYEAIPRGVRHLAALSDAAGYSGAPTVLSKDQYDAVPAEPLYRGVKALPAEEDEYPPGADEMMEQLMYGPFYIGFGSKTNGTYIGDRIEAESFANPRGLWPWWEDQYNGDLDNPDEDPFAEPSDEDELEPWERKPPPLSHDDHLTYDEESALIATKIHPDAKIASVDDLPPYLVDSILNGFVDPNKVYLWLLNNGYDGIDLRQFGHLYGLAIINRQALVIRRP